MLTSYTRWLVGNVEHLHLHFQRIAINNKLSGIKCCVR